MPNWVTNQTTITGSKEALNAFEQKYLTDGNFDFNKVIPMPKSLNMTEGGHQYEATIAYLSDNCQKPYAEVADTIKSHIQNPWFVAKDTYDRTAEILKKDGRFHKYGFGESLEPSTDAKNYMTLYDAGKIYVENIEKYGASTWYEWCVNNWGTKWEACDQYVNRDSNTEMTVDFNTAWSMPEGIFNQFAKDNPSLTIEVMFADEDFGANCGHYIYENGEKTLDVYYRDFCEESKFLAAKVLGDEYLEDYEDEYENEIVEENFDNEYSDDELASIYGGDTSESQKQLLSSDIVLQVLALPSIAMMVQDKFLLKWK